MADDHALASWHLTDDVFSYEQEAPTRIPRGWERAPKSPFAGRHGGRKVWKRFGTLPRDHDEKTEENSAGAGESTAVLGDTTNTSRSVKRLRLKGAPENVQEGKENRPAKYLATLRDKAQGTPRRKQAPRKSLKPDRARIQVQDADDTMKASSTVAEGSVQEDVLRASESPALDDVREILSSPQSSGTTADNFLNGSGCRVDEAEEPEVACQDATIPTSNDVTIPAPSGQEEVSRSSPLAIASSMGPDVAKIEIPEAVTLLSIEEPKPQALVINTSVKSDVAETEVTSNNAVALPTPSRPEGASIFPSTEPNMVEMELPEAVILPFFYEPKLPKSDIDVINSKQAADPPLRPALLSISPSSSKKLLPKRLMDAISPGGSPQIGTSLLRRESLRRKESPSKQKTQRKCRSPKKKRDTLQRRDTLQEREILQQVIAETSQDPRTKDIDRGILEAAVFSEVQLAAEAGDASLDKEYGDSSVPEADEEKPTENYVTGAESPLPPSVDLKVDRDLHRAMEAIEVYENPVDIDAGETPLGDSTDKSEEVEAAERANEVIAKAELEQATQTVKATKEHTELPPRKTRSGARFSDDTSLLRDFLNRAQASKAAKTPILSPLDAPNPQTSPRHSPRKALGPYKSNAPSPQTLGDIANRPGTPPGLPKSDMLDSDDADEVTATPTSCRRSTRTRLPAPSKAPPGAPSFIPVRRADGTDPVVLQKSQAQELAIVTRANTRRNKGQSKPPLLALKELPGDTTEGAGVAKQQAENVKSVGWAETLTSYQDSKEKLDEPKESKPKVRRMRGLGAVNGTPAPKKTTAVVGTSNGTPAPKRRGGKVR